MLVENSHDEPSFWKRETYPGEIKNVNNRPRLLTSANKTSLLVLQSIAGQSRDLNRKTAILGVATVDDWGHPDEDLGLVAKLVSRIYDGYTRFSVSISWLVM